MSRLYVCAWIFRDADEREILGKKGVESSSTVTYDGIRMSHEYNVVVVSLPCGGNHRRPKTSVDNLQIQRIRW